LGLRCHRKQIKNNKKTYMKKMDKEIKKQKNKKIKIATKVKTALKNMYIETIVFI